MLDFVCEFERVVSKWPQEACWTVAQVADYTATGVPQVVEVLSEVLGRELEVHESIGLSDATKALNILKDRLQVQLAARQKRIEETRAKAVMAYDNVMEKVRILQMTKNWRSAYKTLSYFGGSYEKQLPVEILQTLCGDCLRLGMKADANMQELSQWLRKGVRASLTTGCEASLEDALDFIDAYSDFFIDRSQQGGRQLLANMLMRVRESAAQSNLMLQFDNIAKDIPFVATIAEM